MFMLAFMEFVIGGKVGAIIKGLTKFWQPFRHGKYVLNVCAYRFSSTLLIMLSGFMPLRQA